MNAAQKWRGLRIEEELCDAGAVASVFRDVAFVAMKAEAHEGGTESFEVQVIFGIGMEVAEVPGTIEQLLIIFYTNLVAQQVDQVAVYLFSSVAFVREVMVPRFLVAGYRIVAGMVRDIVQISFANTDHQPVEGWEPVEYLS